MRVLVLFAAVLATATTAAAIEPGKWETTGRTVDFDMALPPGVPAGMMDMVKKQMVGKDYSSTQCITRDDLQNAPEKMFRQSEGQCRYDRFSMADGKLDAVATCKMQGTTMRMTMTGTHSANAYSTRMTMAGDGQMGRMTIVSEGSGKRIGDC